MVLKQVLCATAPPLHRKELECFSAFSFSLCSGKREVVAGKIREAEVEERRRMYKVKNVFW